MGAIYGNVIEPVKTCFDKIPVKWQGNFFVANKALPANSGPDTFKNMALF